MKEEDVTIIYYDFFDHLKDDKVRQMCIQSWKDCIPKAKFVCKTEKTPEIAEYIKNSKWCQECLKKKMYSFLGDPIRLWEALNNENFLYLDTDVYMTKNILPLLEKYDFFTGQQLDYVKKKKVFQPGTILWLKGKNKLIEDVLREYDNLIPDKSLSSDIVNGKFSYAGRSEVNNYIKHFHLHFVRYMLKKHICILKDYNKKLPTDKNRGVDYFYYNAPNELDCCVNHCLFNKEIPFEKVKELSKLIGIKLMA